MKHWLLSLSALWFKKKSYWLVKWKKTAEFLNETTSSARERSTHYTTLATVCCTTITKHTGLVMASKALSLLRVSRLNPKVGLSCCCGQATVTVKCYTVWLVQSGLWPQRHQRAAWSPFTPQKNWNSLRTAVRNKQKQVGYLICNSLHSHAYAVQRNDVHVIKIHSLWPNIVGTLSSYRKAAFTPDRPIHVVGYKYPGRATCIRIQVDTCRRNAALKTILSPIEDTCRRRQTIQINGYKWIQLKCIRCKRYMTYFTMVW